MYSLDAVIIRSLSDTCHSRSARTQPILIESKPDFPSSAQSSRRAIASHKETFHPSSHQFVVTCWCWALNHHVIHGVVVQRTHSNQLYSTPLLTLTYLHTARLILAVHCKIMHKFLLRLSLGLGWRQHRQYPSRESESERQRPINFQVFNRFYYLYFVVVYKW